LLTAGHQYTVNVRIRDAVGNWSTIRSTPLTVTPANNIFTNGFESGNTSAWSSSSSNNPTRLSVTTGAALFSANGLQVQGNNTNYVQYNFGTTANPAAAATYDARFYFRPNGNTSAGKDIFVAATANTFNTTLFRVRYRLNGTTPQVQIQVGTNGTSSNWVNITGGTTNNVIEVVWQSGSTLTLYVNGVSAPSLTVGTNSVGAVRLGSVTTTGNATPMFFDAFASKRSVSPLIGP
jgi:hypothetical protein